MLRRRPLGHPSVSGRLGFLKRQYAKRLEANPALWLTFMRHAAVWMTGNPQVLEGGHVARRGNLLEAIHAEVQVFEQRLTTLSTERLPQVTIRLEGALQHVFRWVAAEPDAVTPLADITSIADWFIFTRHDLNTVRTWEAATQLAEAWHATMGGNLSGECVPLSAFKECVLRFENGYGWYRGCSIPVGAAIGRALGHCYQWPDYAHYIPRNYFLLSASGRPAVAIETIDLMGQSGKPGGTTAAQVRGVLNRPPKVALHPMVDAMLMKLCGTDYPRWGDEGIVCLQPRRLAKVGDLEWWVTYTDVLRFMLQTADEGRILGHVGRHSFALREEYDALGRAFMTQMYGSDPGKWGASMSIALPEVVYRFKNGWTWWRTAGTSMRQFRWPAPNRYSSGIPSEKWSVYALVEPTTMRVHATWPRWGLPSDPKIRAMLLPLLPRVEVRDPLAWSNGAIRLLPPERLWTLWQRDEDRFLSAVRGTSLYDFLRGEPGETPSAPRDTSIKVNGWEFQNGHLVLDVTLEADFVEWEMNHEDGVLSGEMRSRWEDVEEKLPLGEDLWDIFRDKYDSGHALSLDDAFGDDLPHGWRAPEGVYEGQCYYDFPDYPESTGTKESFLKCVAADTAGIDVSDEGKSALSDLAHWLGRVDEEMGSDVYRRFDRFLDVMELKVQRGKKREAAALEKKYRTEMLELEKRRSAVVKGSANRKRRVRT